jgi:hypothetical protein
MKDCPEFKLANAYNLGQVMYAGDDRKKKPNFTFPVMHEEELPDDEVRHHGDRGTFVQFKALIISLLASVLCWFTWLPDFRRNLKSCVPTILVVVIVASLVSYAFAEHTHTPSSYVRGSSYLNSESINVSPECEWLADTGPTGLLRMMPTILFLAPWFTPH